MNKYHSSKPHFRHAKTTNSIKNKESHRNKSANIEENMLIKFPDLQSTHITILSNICQYM